MSFLDAIILGLIQGLTEYIPISSTAHLIVADHLLGLNSSFTFDVLLNFGTLLALITYYRKAIWVVVLGVFKKREWRLIKQLIVATIPAALVGMLFTQQIAAIDEKIWIIIVALVALGILMIIYGDGNSKNKHDLTENKALAIPWMTSIKIGLAQAIALIPGTSRSGITILVGLKSGLSSKKAAEFSFLLGIPIIAGASFKTLLSSDGINFIQNNLGAFIIGNIVSFAVGLLAISLLITLIGKRGLRDFGWYRIVLAVILVILLITGII